MRYYDCQVNNKILALPFNIPPPPLLSVPCRWWNQPITNSHYNSSFFHFLLLLLLPLPHVTQESTKDVLRAYYGYNIKISMYQKRMLGWVWVCVCWQMTITVVFNSTRLLRYYYYSRWFILYLLNGSAPSTLPPLSTVPIPCNEFNVVFGFRECVYVARFPISPVSLLLRLRQRCSVWKKTHKKSIINPFKGTVLLRSQWAGGC